MKQIVRLTIVMLRGSGFAVFGSDAKKKKKLGSLGSLLLFAFLFIYMALIMGGSSMGLYKMLEPFSLTALIPQLYLSAAAVMTFVFGVVYAISIFYYSSDVIRLLPLPLRSGEIISAKLLVTVVYIELVIMAFLLPSLTVYGVNSNAAWYYYFLMVISLLILPLIPLCAAAVLVILIMRLTPFARNKDRFNTISSLLLLVGTFGLVSFIQSMAGRGGSEFAEWIEAGTDSLTNVTSSVFPGVAQASRLLAHGSASLNLIDLLLLILFAAVAWLIVLLVGRAFYFQGVVSVAMSGGRKRHLDGKELESVGKAGSLFWTMVIKDSLLLIRTPIFLMNNVIMNFLWPIFLLMPLMTQGSFSETLSELRQAAAMVEADSDFIITVVLMIVFAFSAFVAGTNGIAASALSREGKLLYVMKMIPVSYSKQLLAKVTVGVLMALAGALVAVIAAVILVLPPFWLVIPILAVLPGACALPSCAGMIFDLLWPKLNWDNEQRAVKQNLNVLYGMLAALVLIAICVLPAYLLSAFWPLAFAALVILPWLLSAVLYFIMRSMSSRQMAAIEA